jgi:hypothetical protein
MCHLADVGYMHYHIRPSTVATGKSHQCHRMKILQFFDASSFMPVERVRKPRDKPAPYAHKPGPKGKHAKDETETSAKSAATKQRDNLTLRDWLTVFAFIDGFDAHPTLSQERVLIISPPWKMAP